MTFRLDGEPTDEPLHTEAGENLNETEEAPQENGGEFFQLEIFRFFDRNFSS